MQYHPFYYHYIATPFLTAFLIKYNYSKMYQTVCECFQLVIRA